MASIPLSKGKSTIVDDEDFLSVSIHNWSYANGYARVNIVVDGSRENFKTKPIYLHRKLMGLSDGDKRYVDHINGDKLDNRMENLRLCNPSQNAMNYVVSRASKSGVRGVFRNKKTGKWIAQMIMKGHKTWSKSFESFEQAVSARKKREVEFFGEFRSKA